MNILFVWMKSLLCKKKLQYIAMEGVFNDCVFKIYDKHNVYRNAKNTLICICIVNIMIELKSATNKKHTA